MSYTPTSDTLVVTRLDKVLHVTLNRPDVGNAFDGTLIAELIGCFTAIAADPSVHVVVLGGAGKSFCAGADIKWMRSQGLQSQADNAADARKTASFFELIDACPKPIIGRIHGACRGGGVGLAACVDIPIGTPSATFALTEVRIGLAPAIISPYVVRKIGARWAREVFLTGAPITAEAGLAMGLLNHLVPDEAALDAKVESVVKQLVEGGPLALAACKDLARTIAQIPADEAVTKTANLIAHLRGSPEGLEGTRAFVMKDRPAWTK